MNVSQKLVRLIHNPTAGTGQYSEKEIVPLIESKGYECDYSTSKKKALKDIRDETDFYIIAGGDGTIRKIVLKLLNKRLKDKRPIALLPFGTANNIATTLKLADSAEKNIDFWAHCHLKSFDVGLVLGLKKPAFFLESFGFGLFPRLMKELKKSNTTDVKTAEDEFELALNTMLKLAESYQATSCIINTGDEVYEGDYLLIELMNIPLMGPNLKLGENADPGDGWFDLVMVTADQRNLLTEYLSNKCAGKEVVFPFKPIRTKRISITWQGKDIHIDDEIIKGYHGNRLNVSILDSLLEFMTSKKL